MCILLAPSWFLRPPHLSSAHSLCAFGNARSDTFGLLSSPYSFGSDLHCLQRTVYTRALSLVHRFVRKRASCLRVHFAMLTGTPHELSRCDSRHLTIGCAEHSALHSAREPCDVLLSPAQYGMCCRLAMSMSKVTGGVSNSGALVVLREELEFDPEKPVRQNRDFLARRASCLLYWST
ncbi:hypothetical protein EXIGLDRAFT_105660 [Exidia glandulosa HHB12029]|uniref:Uncharacterized protein n=1 Tax=Exidia glandulosa HHB12029 TaxID=1314781 RepID=A0A165GU16_EXIGL|nr:hypothetical protein EXIGLDRAFT_105660 [Exidia glandulosa HHB12029]